LGQFSKNYRTFSQKIVTKFLKIWVWDPGSEIWDLEKNLARILDPGVKKAPDHGSGSATLVPGILCPLCGKSNDMEKSNMSLNRRGAVEKDK
jgi:hypothetical protein